MSDDINCTFPNHALLQKVSFIGQHLKQKGWWMSCAESCTGGGLAYVLTSVAGSSDWFQQSVVTYSNQSKQQQLSVPASILAEYGAVSSQTVAAMVHGLETQWNAQVAVAISGIAGPGGATLNKPVGLVWFGFAVDTKRWTVAIRFSGDRLSVRQQAIIYAIEQIALALVPQSIESHVSKSNEKDNDE